MSEEESSQVPQNTSTKTEPKADIEALPQIEQETPCPVPSEHIKVFGECCEEFKSGNISELDVISKVVEQLRKIKKEE